MMPVKIVDLFAGPGGLGEGFSAFENGKKFQIAISAEMESSAHATLQLRSFFRLVRSNELEAKSYYNFCNGKSPTPYDEHSLAAWKDSLEEARQLTLGLQKDNAELDRILDDRLKNNEEWVLIGGPPCQAYSLVGRSRNQGKVDYRAEDDHRHFLYKEYLRIIQARRPAVFVMENVKGILSARVGGKKIFPEILRDLSDPDAALGKKNKRGGYRIFSLVKNTCYENGMAPEELDPSDFVIKAENFGIPQARHRVILLGIREDIDYKFSPLTEGGFSTVSDALINLPKLRSRLSKENDSDVLWADVIKKHYSDLAADAMSQGFLDLGKALKTAGSNIRSDLSSGALRVSKDRVSDSNHLLTWYDDPKIEVWLNHETRSHMTSDMRRYAYASTYAALYGTSPKGHEQFFLSGLRPDHDNWETGKFSDRFRVQKSTSPSTTITSHIAKDGHYFIHPDQAQCRSLTVREAARLQTFPDNYFFAGNRTQQFHQVGNAVPPLLANQIAKIVSEIMDGI